MCSSMCMWRSREGVQWVCCPLHFISPRSARREHQRRLPGDAAHTTHTDGCRLYTHRWRNRGDKEGEGEICVDCMITIAETFPRHFVLGARQNCLYKGSPNGVIILQPELDLLHDDTLKPITLSIPSWRVVIVVVCVLQALSSLHAISLDRCYGQVEDLTTKLEGLKQRFGLSSTQRLVHSAQLEMEKVVRHSWQIERSFKWGQIRWF